MSNRDMMGNDGSKDPWELAAQNVQVSYSTENVPLLFGYKGDGTMIQLLNSAGSRLLIEGQRIIRQISFSYCVKAGRTGEAPINDRVIINAKTEKTAGYTFKPFTAMLMPMNATFVQDVDDNGDIYRRYWQIEAVIMENASTWVRRALDVGTKALFGDKKIPQPIYQYYEWTNPDANANFEVPPSFGSISDVERAKMHFADIGGGVRSNSEDWNKRYDMVPYNEMTEPLPLNNGKIYLDAIKDPEKYPYKTINYFENKPGSWAKWNLPKGRA